MARRRLLVDGHALEDVNTTIAKKVRNRFQSYEGAAEMLNQLFGFDMTNVLDPAGAERLKHTLEKRHPITHNLGIVDRKYLEKVRTGEAEGRDVNLDEQEVLTALDTVLAVARGVHRDLFPRRTTGGESRTHE